MKLSYSDFSGIPIDFSIIILFRFLNETRNCSLMPSKAEDYSLPPVLYWWFKEEDPDVNQFIKKCIDDFDWQDKWVLEQSRGKWLLYPEATLQAERLLQGVDNDTTVELTRDASLWLENNNPEIGYRTNMDLQRFKYFFKDRIEEYLKAKEQTKH